MSYYFNICIIFQCWKIYLIYAEILVYTIVGEQMEKNEKL